MESETVFLIDDDAAVRRSLTLSLQKRGLNVEAFATAEAFLQSCDCDRPGCLVLDIQMPGMTGMELQQALAQQGCAIPIIFITGHGDVPMSVRAMKHGAVDFLEKPVRHRVLLKSIEQALAADRRTRSRRAETEDARTRYDELTPREREVMGLLVSGSADLTNKQIARRLGISHRTVDQHRARIMEKMHAKSHAHLVALASAFELRSEPRAIKKRGYYSDR